MDYVTRQFINLTKKFRKELRTYTTDLNTALQKQAEAIRNSRQVNEEKQSQPPEVSVINNLPSSVEVHQNEKDTYAEKNYRRFTFLLSALTFAAVAIYAVITYQQWKTASRAILDAQESSDKQFAKMTEQIRALQTANAIAVAANRPWMGSVSGSEFSFQEGRDDSGVFMSARYIWSFKNAGKRPARIEKIRTTSNWSKTCTDNPNYNFTPPGNPLHIGMNHSHSLEIPDATSKSVFQIGIPIKQWYMIKNSDLQFCIYSLIEYRDVGGDESVIHRTTDCRVLSIVGGMTLFPECDNGYANAD